MNNIPAPLPMNQGATGSTLAPSSHALTKRLSTLTPLDLLLPPLPGESNQSGIDYFAETGLFGVIFGAAGSGKSVLSLQLCSGFASGATPNGKHRHSIYVTQEPLNTIKSRLEAFRSFSDEVEPPFLIRMESVLEDRTAIDASDTATLTLVNMPLDPASQKDKLSYLLGLLNAVFCRTNDATAADPDPKQRLLLCIDNADTISQQAYEALIKNEVAGSFLERAFYKRVREYCARHRLNSWFVFEEQQTQSRVHEDVNIATTEVAYAADIVLRLGVTVYEAGYRERSLEIVKAKNQSYRRGRHHFSIRGKDQVPPGSKPGLTVFPSLPTQLYSQCRDASGSPRSPVPAQHHHRIGLPEVDKAISARMASEKCRAQDACFLSGGTVTVLVSDLDSQASELALHFALQEALEGKDPAPTVYFSTLHREEQLKDMMRLYALLQSQSAHKNLQFLYLSPDHVSDAKLLKDIDNAINKHHAKRVVLDNIFELKSKFPLLRDPKHFLNALFSLFRTSGVAAFVVDMVEVGEGRNPLDQSFIAGLADHVFVLRHTESHARPRKIFSVLKLAGHDEPDGVWELRPKLHPSHAEGDRALPQRLEAQDLSQHYKGVLSGALKPVSVTLSLYADTPESPLHQHLQLQQAALEKTFGHSITFHPCHPTAYEAMQQSISSAALRALGDCHVISVDEIWLEQLIRDGKLARVPAESFGAVPNEWNHEHFVTVAEDMALDFLKRPIDNNLKFAVPERSNVGVLACNPVAFMLSKRSGQWASVLEEWEKKHRLDLGNLMTHGNINEKGCAIPSWRQLIELQDAYLLHITSSGMSYPDWPYPTLYREWEEEQECPKRQPNQNAGGDVLKDWGVFSFSMEHQETCVCFLLELVLGQLHVPENMFTERGGRRINFGKRLSSGGCDAVRAAWNTALELLVQLLSPWDLLRLADSCFRASEVERPCLFSRQWFSSSGVIGRNFPGLHRVELPAGECGKPVPVSGTWYYAILQGSSSVKAGSSIIKHLTDPSEEIFKLNRGIGLPVRKKIYQNRFAPMEVRTCVPYRKTFAELAGANREVWESIHPEFPIFYRSRVKDYRRLSSQLLGMMVFAAREATSASSKEWIWRRSPETWSPLKAKLASLVEQAAESYDQP